jgi:hypothetical protein
MRNAPPAGFFAALIPVLLLTVSCASSESDTPPQGYASPAAVFEAYREARIKRDWSKIFFLLTPDAQNDALFEGYFECGIRDSKESNAILSKYGLDDASLKIPLRKEYQEKYGVDIATLDENSHGEATRTPPSLDRESVVEFVSAQVKDKVGFFGSVANLSRDIPVAPLGDLEQVVIHNDAATGGATMTTAPTLGEPPPVVDKTHKTFRFRRVNGGWLLDSL